MFSTTITSASTKAMSSSVEIDVPQSVNAGAIAPVISCRSSGINASTAAVPAALRLGGRWRARHLHQNLVGLDHAELEARFLLDHLEAFLQVAHLGVELRVARLRTRVHGELSLQLALQLH